jgi:hypothetical protein
MQIENAVGPQIAADGTFPKSRATRDASSGVQDTHGHFQEAVGRGNVFTAVTGVAGVAPGTVLSTTPPFTLSNPLGSGVNLVVLVAEFLYISGTIGAGTVYYGVNNAPGQAAPTGGTALTPINNIVGNTGCGQGQGGSGSHHPGQHDAFRSGFRVPRHRGRLRRDQGPGGRRHRHRSRQLPLPARCDGRGVVPLGRLLGDLGRSPAERHVITGARGPIPHALVSLPRGQPCQRRSAAQPLTAPLRSS